MKVATLWHKPCNEHILSFLTPDIRNSIKGYGKFKCMHCGKDNISLGDDDVQKVVGTKIDMYVLENAKIPGRCLMVDGFPISFATQEQALLYAKDLGIDPSVCNPIPRDYDIAATNGNTAAQCGECKDCWEREAQNGEKKK